MKLTVWMAAIVIAGLASTAIAHAQTAADPTPSATTMVVSGFAPVTAGATITVEALDPTTIKGVECGRVQTQAAAAAPAGTSRFATSVGRSCIARASGNLRACWGPETCVNFEFAVGKKVDLGTLKIVQETPSAPDAGSTGAPDPRSIGAPDAGGGESPSNSGGFGTLSVAVTGGGLVLLAVGVACLLAAGVRRRRQSQ